MNGSNEIRLIYEVRPRTDKRGVDLISNALPFGASGTASRMQSVMRSGTQSVQPVARC
jgi:hypothetical protein